MLVYMFVANFGRASIGFPFSRYCLALQAASGPSYRPKVKLFGYVKRGCAGERSGNMKDHNPAQPPNGYVYMP